MNLGLMRERFGHKAGTFIHVVAYSLCPLVAGIIFIMKGLSGQAFF
jgi:hypothetical protein